MRASEFIIETPRVAAHRPEILSATDNGNTITIKVRTHDGSVREMSNSNPAVLQQWLNVKYGLRLPHSIARKFVGMPTSMVEDQPDNPDSWESQAADAERDTETAKMAAQDAKAGGLAEETVDEDLSRRGFLKGAGAAALVGAAGSAMAQSRPVDVSREFQNMRQDDPRVQHNKDIEEMTRAIYDQIVATRGQPIDRRQQQMWMTIAREKATEKLSKYAPGRSAPQSQSSGFPAQGSERKVSRNIDNFESQGVAEKLGDHRPKLGSKRDAGKSVRKWRSERGLDEVDAQNFVGGMTAGYQRRENQPVDENQGWAATYENTTSNPRVDLTPNYPNYAILVGEFIGIKKNRAVFRVISAELKPGQGETEKIFRAMSTNTPIGIEISRVKNRAVLEALKPNAFAALQQAKQNIEQNRQQEVDQWEQDFRANSAKLAGQQLKQRFAEPPPEPPTMPVVQPGESPAALRDRLAQLNIAKQKFEEINVLIKAIKKKYQHSAIEAEINAIERRLETGLLPDVRAGVADNYKSLLAKLDNLKTSLTTRFIVKEAPDYIDEANK